MSAPVGPGRILIDVVLDDRGRVASVTLDSSRPAGMARLFIGRPAQDVPALAGQLFSICGFSHGVASQLAIAAARGEKPQDRQVFSFVIGLAGERLSESLRASALGWPHRRGKSEAVSRVATPLCEAMESARLLIAAAGRGDAWKCRAALARAAERIADAATRFGLQTAAPHAPEPGSVFAAMMGEAQMDAAFRTCDPDVITSADDPVIAAALREGGAHFSSAPTLPDRIIETGAFARHWRAAKNGAGSFLAARLAARFIDLAETIEIMRQALSTGEAAMDGFATAAATGEGEAFAAVETPRGRLYHWLRIGDEDRVTAYELLAPTEWNFSPAGPLAAALLGADVGAGEEARLRIERLAAVFDPCVAFEVNLSERSHA